MEKTKDHPLLKIKWPIIAITTYRGCIITRIIGGYMCFEKKCLTEADVDLVIDTAQKSLEKSLSK